MNSGTERLLPRTNPGAGNKRGDQKANGPWANSFKEKMTADQYEAYAAKDDDNDGTPDKKDDDDNNDGTPDKEDPKHPSYEGDDKEESEINPEDEE